MRCDAMRWQQQWMKDTNVMIRIVVECRAIDIVQIQGIEREAIGSSNDYLIGHVRRKEEKYVDGEQAIITSSLFFQRNLN